ncbi:hypothetical protein FRX31_021446 [Thalictrum thalictroides]|uniref:Uncharacterized protein n=1 Tax=Thalictrum thalictroides TaxID=46969 RepID=A0A7J6VWH9_THATH|nr:hypothetical protein FRX31_021446 [Thalictrum thalictroides]
MLITFLVLYQRVTDLLGTQTTLQSVGLCITFRLELGLESSINEQCKDKIDIITQQMVRYDNHPNKNELLVVDGIVEPDRVCSQKKVEIRGQKTPPTEQLELQLSFLLSSKFNRWTTV